MQDRLATVGILQEQHPDRARLFMQWKRMEWPLLVDSLDLLEVPYVPITLAIDENGVIRAVDPPLHSPGELKKSFVEHTDAVPERPPARTPAKPDLTHLRAAAFEGGAAAWRAYGDALVHWGGGHRLGEAVEAFERALAIDPDDGTTHFHLGVAYRNRFDSRERRRGDFRNAVEAWTRALEIDPNNYIWRRRIQQYGPRLEKPYPFYDWVTTAKQEIRARGEAPLPLRVTPSGAEFAHPARDFGPTRDSDEEPDPRGRVKRDARSFIRVDTVVVPPRIAAGGTARAHLTFTPNPSVKAHWNNEVSDLVLWIDRSGGWRPESRRVMVPNPPTPVSQEVRNVEFEFELPEGVEPGPAAITGYALYYVCEDVKGTCLYRRQDVKAPFEIVASTD